MSLVEKNAALLNSLKEHEGSLANAEFEDGQVSEGYRRNVVHYISHFRAKGKVDSRADAYTDRKQTCSVTYDLTRRRGSSMHDREGLENEQLLHVERTEYVATMDCPTGLSRRGESVDMVDLTITSL